MLEDLLENLPEADAASAEEVRRRATRVLRPAGAFHRLDEIATWLAGWQRTERPVVERPAVVVFFADHGVADEGVSAYPTHVTASMLAAARAGTATISAMASALGIPIEIVDVGVGQPSGNIVKEPALMGSRFAKCVRRGREAVAALDCDLLVLGEMGIGNTTPAAAVSAALFGGPVEQWVGPGSGLDERGMEAKRATVAAALARAGPLRPLEVLGELGGAELAALAGATMEARHRSIPCVLDGYVATAAVMPLEVARPGALDHVWPGHLSPEPGHRLLLERLGREPLLDLELRLGEGTGALAAVPIIRLAAASVVGVATFEEWGLE